VAVYKPWLIQRATIRTPLAEENTRISFAVKLDYMGSAEFEFGALPKSLRNLQARKDQLKLRLLTTVTQDESPLRIYSSLDDADFIEYTAIIEKLRKSRLGEVRLKERSEFTLEEVELTNKRNEADRLLYATASSKRKKKSPYGQYVRELADFWWDLNNDTMFSFHKIFMNRLPSYLEGSWEYMDEQKEKGSA
jgi:hypothetical protein